MHAKYSELNPERLAELLATGSPIVWPWGALEWHGEHLPLGLDGIVAEEFSIKLADRVGGILIPTCWLPITTLPHRFSQQITTGTLRRVLDESIQGLGSLGRGPNRHRDRPLRPWHEIELYEAALRAMEDLAGLRVYCAAPLELLGEEMLDHAGRIESSQLLSVRPDLVSLGGLPEELSAKKHGVLGEHPKDSSAEEGERLTAAALDLWVDWLNADAQRLRDHYGRAFDRYQSYVDDFHAESWEQAIVDWWATKSAGNTRGSVLCLHIFRTSRRDCEAKIARMR